MKKFNKLFSVLFVIIILISAFTAVPFTACAATDSSESTCTATYDLGGDNIYINIPLISLVPIPALTIDEVDIIFDMMVK